ncbi:MAG: DinB family protein [Reichenbachiella sp.]
MNSSIDAIQKLMIRDLAKLEEEILAYKVESDLWLLNKAISNTAGNLCLHLCGNIQHFFGHIIGKSDYIRQRDDEFDLKNVPRIELLDFIQKSVDSINASLENFDETLWEEPFPQEVFGYPMTYGYFMIHLSGHLNYHLGQINYHRRLLAE